MNQLGDLCDVKSGGTPPRGQYDCFGGAIPWAKISDIEASNGDIFTTKESITEKGLIAISNRIFPAGTVLLALYGSVGKAAIAGIPLSTNQAILGLQIKDNGILDNRYLLHWLKAKQPDLMSMARGATLKNISAGIVKNLSIPLPPIAQQRRIVESLNAKMADIAKAKAAAESQLEAITALPAACLRRAFPSAEK